MLLPSTLFISENESAKTAMKQIDSNDWGVLFVVDKNKVLKGVITPGDIRRAIDVGQDIHQSIELFMNTSPLTIKEGINPKEATTLIFQDLRAREKKVNEEICTIQIPVINKKKQVVDIATFSQNEKSLSLEFGQDTLKLTRGIRKVLIVGGAGYLGSVLTRLLLKNGYRVRVLDSLLFGTTSIEELYSNPDFDLIQGDVRDIQTVHKSLHGVDAVIHLAAIVGDPASQKYPQDTIGVNYLATMTLALACRYYQINKFIFASTCSVYGVGQDKLDEDAPLNPVSLYARTKIESEKGILSLKDENFHPIIMRMSTLYGVSPRMRFDLVVNTFAKMATVDGQITIFGGNQWRPLLNVEDAASAYLKVLEHPLTDLDSLVFNVGTNEQNYTIKELGELVKETLPQTKVNIEKAVENGSEDKRTYQVSFDKIEKVLNFTAEHSVKTSLSSISKKIKSKSIKNPNHNVYYNVTQ